jgi:nicotinic acid mononucleotide adenylyltransferase
MHTGHIIYLTQVITETVLKRINVIHSLVNPRKSMLFLFGRVAWKTLYCEDRASGDGGSPGHEEGAFLDPLTSVTCT